jgi:hypothetical protein
MRAGCGTRLPLTLCNCKPLCNCNVSLPLHPTVSLPLYITVSLPLYLSVSLPLYPTVSLPVLHIALISEKLKPCSSGNPFAEWPCSSTLLFERSLFNIYKCCSYERYFRTLRRTKAQEWNSAGIFTDLNLRNIILYVVCSLLRYNVVQFCRWLWTEKK